jgi:drug/metabolite transporter (DMT)-like permease
MEQANEPLAQPQKRASWKLIVLLQLAIVLFAGCTLLMKVAAQYDMFSWNWILLYGLGVFILAGYALVWQQFLKRMPLVTVYANRATAMFWSMIFGYFIFHETIRWNMIVGVLIIFFGIYLVVTSDGE